MRRVPKKRVFAIGAFVAAVLIWFLTVHRSAYVYRCPDCRYGRDVLQYRCFGICVKERTAEFESGISRIARDLGVPCAHAGMECWHKQRWWGLLFCAYPCYSGTVRLVGGTDGWYDSRGAAIVREMAERDPALAGVFRERVLEQHDMGWFRAFVSSVHSRNEERQRETE